MKIRENNKFVKVCIALFVLLVTCSFANLQEAAAASCDITLEVEESEVAVGTEFYLVITVTSEDAIGDLEAYFTYNNKVLEFVTGGTVAADRKEYFQLTDVGSEEGSLRKKYAVKFKALKRGTSSFTVMEPCAVYATETGEAMSVSSNMTSVTVKKKLTVSQNQDSESSVGPEKTGGKMDTTLEENNKEAATGETGGSGVIVTPEETDMGRDSTVPGEPDDEEDSELEESDDDSSSPAVEADEGTITETTPQGTPSPTQTVEGRRTAADGSRSLIIFLSLTICLIFAGVGIFIVKRLS